MSMRVFVLERARVGPQLRRADRIRVAVSDDGRIGSLSDADAATADERIDGFVIPGLVDCHVHLGLSGGSEPVSDAETMDVGAWRSLAAHNANLQVACGVTTVRDLGSPHPIGGSTVPGSPLRILSSEAVTPPGGHGHFVATEVEDLADVEAVLDRAHATGVPWLKVFATGGVMTDGTDPDRPQFPSSTMRAMTEAAHGRGILVAAHAHSAVGIAASLDAGVDTIEHVSYADETICERIVHRGTVAVSTLVATDRFDAHDDAGTPESRSKIAGHAPHERAALRRLVTAGARVVAGTDAGTTVNPHGSGLAEQAELMARAGMSNTAVVRSMTVDAAAAIRADAGYLDVGRPADFIVLDRDPIEDLGALRSVSAVVIGGELVQHR